MLLPVSPPAGGEGVICASLPLLSLSGMIAKSWDYVVSEPSRLTTAKSTFTFFNWTNKGSQNP